MNVSRKPENDLAEQDETSTEAMANEEAESPKPETAHQVEGASAQGEKSLQDEIDTLRDQLLRSRAEVENVLRRAEREKQDMAAYAISGFARDLLAVADNLRRALEAVPADNRGDGVMQTLVEGVEMTERELLSAFAKHGIEKIVPTGEKFDHNYHQAMAEVDAPDSPAGMVVDVYQPGYSIKSRLLRPAMVTVAKGGPKEGKAQGDTLDTEA